MTNTTVTEGELHFSQQSSITVGIMRKQSKIYKKSYALQRMALAIDQAISAPSRKAKERAARWAAAWGMLGGIKTRKVRLKRLDPRDIVIPSLESAIVSIHASSSAVNPTPEFDELSQVYSHQSYPANQMNSHSQSSGER